MKGDVLYVTWTVNLVSWGTSQHSSSKSSVSRSSVRSPRWLFKAAKCQPTITLLRQPDSQQPVAFQSHHKQVRLRRRLTCVVSGRAASSLTGCFFWKNKTSVLSDVLCSSSETQKEPKCCLLSRYFPTSPKNTFLLAPPLCSSRIKRRSKTTSDKRKLVRPSMTL